MTPALFIIAALAIPFIALRGRPLRRCFECELAAVLVFAGLAAFGRVLGIDAALSVFHALWRCSAPPAACLRPRPLAVSWTAGSPTQTHARPRHFGPPIVFYATRIWPEVPAAFFFLEALRGVRQRRPPRWIAATLALVLLKIRFGLLAIVLLARVLRTRKQAIIAAALVAVPLVLAFLISG